MIHHPDLYWAWRLRLRAIQTVMRRNAVDWRDVADVAR